MMHNLLELSEFPPSSCGSLREWVDEIAATFWADWAEFAEIHQGLECAKPNLPELLTPGWHRLTDWYWEPCEVNDIPSTVTMDVEARKKTEDSPAYPVLAVAYGLCPELGAGRWYAWKGRGESDTLIPFQLRQVVGHNIAAFDSRFLSCEYEPLEHSNSPWPDGCQYLDTMSLATLTRGLSSDTMEALYAKCQGHIASGHQAPVWYEHAWTVSLKELAKRLLGIQLDKSVRGEQGALALDMVDQVSGKDLLNYCALDVWVTHQIFQKLYPIVDKQFFSSPVSWVGMSEMAHCKLWLKDWDGFLANAEAEWVKVKQELADFVEDLAGDAHPIKFPLWDWSVLTRGQYKGWPKWKQKLDQDGYSINSRAAVELLELRWDGEPIEWEQVNARVGQWVTKEARSPLPHPSGGERLGSPLCKDYRGFAVSGRLTSDVLEAEGLVEVFDALAKVGQWTSFRSRYHDVYRPHRTGDDLDLVKPDINPAGCLSRRASSPLWLVTPKEREGTIGSDVQSHIVAPPGYSIIYADFDSQESWLMSLLTDAQAGTVGSNEWSRSVLYGDKAQGTDTHSLIASKFGIPRDVGKTVNFASSYLAGVVTIANTLWMALNCPREHAEKLAADFIDLLKGEDGIAKETFATLKKLAKTPHIRTAILGVKIPDSLNAAWCGNEFMTTRQNWQIQSTGVDCLHSLIVLAKAFFTEYDIEAHLMLHRHDAVYWLVPTGKEEIGQQVLQTAHYWVKRLAYEQAVAHAHQLKTKEGFAGEAVTLEPPEQALWFSSVDIGGNAGEF